MSRAISSISLPNNHTQANLVKEKLRKLADEVNESSGEFNNSTQIANYLGNLIKNNNLNIAKNTPYQNKKNELKYVDTGSFIIVEWKIPDSPTYASRKLDIIINCDTFNSYGIKINARDWGVVKKPSGSWTDFLFKEVSDIIANNLYNILKSDPKLSNFRIDIEGGTKTLYLNVNKISNTSRIKTKDTRSEKQYLQSITPNFSFLAPLYDELKRFSDLYKYQMDQETRVNFDKLAQKIMQVNATFTLLQKGLKEYYSHDPNYRPMNLKNITKSCYDYTTRLANLSDDTLSNLATFDYAAANQKLTESGHMFNKVEIDNPDMLKFDVSLLKDCSQESTKAEFYVDYIKQTLIDTEAYLKPPINITSTNNPGTTTPP